MDSKACVYFVALDSQPDNERRRHVREDYFGAPAHLKSRQPVSDAQARCDGILSDYRANPQPTASSHYAVPPPAPPPSDDTLMLRLGEELDYARRMLDAMGDDLCGDPAVVMRHNVALQSVDIVGQMLGHIANVVRSSRPTDSVALIGMCDLKARLTRRSLY